MMKTDTRLDDCCSCLYPILRGDKNKALNNGLQFQSIRLLYAPLVGAGGFEPPELRSQSPLPYRLAMPQYMTSRAKPYSLKDTQRRNTVGWFALPSPLPLLTLKDWFCPNTPRNFSLLRRCRRSHPFVK